MDDQGPGFVLSTMGGGQGCEQGAALSLQVESGSETTQQSRAFLQPVDGAGGGSTPVGETLLTRDRSRGVEGGGRGVSTAVTWDHPVRGALEMPTHCHGEVWVLVGGESRSANPHEDPPRSFSSPSSHTLTSLSYYLDATPDVISFYS